MKININKEKHVVYKPWALPIDRHFEKNIPFFRSFVETHLCLAYYSGID